MQEDRGIIHSDDLLVNVSIASNSKAGKIIAQLDLSPLKFQGTNWYNTARMYANWKPFRDLLITVVPSASVVTSGTYKWGWTMDSSLDLTDGPGAIRAVSSFQNSGTKKIHEPVTIRVPAKTVQALLFTRGERGESDQGTIYLVLNSGIGNLTEDSEISFSINSSITCAYSNRLATPDDSDTEIYPESGYSNYFTDSSSDVAEGTKLTLKTTQGGNVTPFVGAVSRAVYKFEGTSLKYAKASETAATATGIVTHASPIQNSSTRGLFVFENETKATAYASSGDTANCITYVAAGPWVTPTGAGFKLVKTPPPAYSNRNF